MADDFEGMFQKVRQEHIDASAASRKRADSQREDAIYGFNLKAECLKRVVIPTLEEARESFANNGLDLIIKYDVEAGPNPQIKDPWVGFSFKKRPGSTVAVQCSNDDSYVISVTHVQGGVNYDVRSDRETGMSFAADFDAPPGADDGNDLERHHIVKFVEYALKNSTHF